MEYVVLFILVAVTVLLITDRWEPHFVFSAAALLLLLSGAITPKELLTSFSNTAVVSIFILIIITAAINDYFSLPKLFDPILGKAKTVMGFNLRMGMTIGPLSAIMNNTPLVALMTPYAYNWTKKNGFSPSQVLMPLSFITILGGMLTTIGTSTNLVLNGLIIAGGYESLKFSDFLVPGLMVGIPGVLFISIFTKRLLYDRTDLLDNVDSSLREYLFETEVTNDSIFIGKSIQDAELRNLNGLFLVEIMRKNEVISPVRPDEKIFAGDRLFFAGESDKVLTLLDGDNGLKMPISDGHELSRGLNIVEAVVPANSDLVNRTLKEVKFREIFDAAVIAIHRNGERLKGKIGEIEIDKGDLLLISTGSQFSRKVQTSNDLYPITTIRKIKQVAKWKKNGVLISFPVIILLGYFIPSMSLFTTLLTLLSALVVFGHTDLEAIKRHTSFKLLFVLGPAIALSESLITSGAADIIGNQIASFRSLLSPFAMLCLIYVVTVIFTLFVTNAAAVAIMFPVSVALIPLLGVPSIALFLCIAFAASCSFVTPFGYQTNLMVYGPGNYKFKDFVRFGSPLTLLYSGIILSYLYWKYFI